MVKYKSLSEMIDILNSLNNYSGFLTISTMTKYNHRKTAKSNRLLKAEDEFKGQIYKFVERPCEIRGNKATYTNRKLEMNPDYENKGLKGFEYVKDSNILLQSIKSGEIHVRVFFRNANAYLGENFILGYEDGTPLTKVELALLESEYKAAVKVYPDEEMVRNIPIKGIMGLRVNGEEYIRNF